MNSNAKKPDIDFSFDLNPVILHLSSSRLVSLFEQLDHIANSEIFWDNKAVPIPWENRLQIILLAAAFVVPIPKSATKPPKPVASVFDWQIGMASSKPLCQFVESLCWVYWRCCSLRIQESWYRFQTVHWQRRWWRRQVSDSLRSQLQLRIEL